MFGRFGGFGSLYGYGGYDDGIGYGGFNEVSACATRNSEEARSRIAKVISETPPHATEEVVLADVVGPKTHIVDNLWGALSRSFKEKHVLLKRRPITPEERASLKISTKRPRYFISVHILPLSKRSKPAKPAKAAAAAAAAATPAAPSAGAAAAAAGSGSKGGSAQAPPPPSGLKRAREE